MKVKGFILAGGKSSRMGTDKGLLQISDKPLVQYSFDIAKEICSEVYTGTNNANYTIFGYKLIPDILSGIGPIGGLHAALTLIEADYVFLLSCDIPNAPAQLALSMFERLGEYEIIVPVWGDNKIEPLFGFYSKSILPVVEKQIETGNFKMIDLLNRCKTLFFNIDPAIDGSFVFKNFNTPVDVSK